MSKREDILGVRVSVWPKEKIMEEAASFLKKNGGRKLIVCANPHSIVTARKDRVFFDALNSADICLPDGHGVVMASKALGGGIRQRLAGTEFFLELSAILNGKGKGVRYFFLGSAAGTLRRIEERMKIKFPNIRLAGFYSPPFGGWSEEENAKIVGLVNRSGCDVLWVGLGAPKQEKWLYENLGRLDIKLAGAIGAAFDFFAGTKKRSPEIFRNMGLEWLPRLVMEPGRLWKRNLVSTPLFLYLLSKEKKRRAVSSGGGRAN